MRLARGRVALRQVALSKPYELSIGTLGAFESVLVMLERSNGSVGIGEAVALPGYGWETTDTILRVANDLIAGISGIKTKTLIERCRREWPNSPFAASAVMAAIELPDWLHYAQSGVRFPLNAALAPSSNESALVDAAETALSMGYRYLKLKVGLDVSSDIAAMRVLLGGLPGRDFKVVADANQAYSIEQALKFLRSVTEMKLDRFLWLEQPLGRLDWDGTKYLCKRTALPIVLDECIYDETHVRRAAEMGARGIKLKLMKNFGLAETVRLAKIAHELKMRVIFGNGVATDVGNLAEFLVLASAPGHFIEPSESSGFAKLTRAILPGLKVSNGNLSCDATAETMARELHQIVADLALID